MIRKIENKNMGKSNLGWLNSSFHFSFAEYFNPLNLNFGSLRVLNDDYIEAGTGFGMHPHKDMEIISYLVEGELTHQDSMGNKRAITRGEVQYMSAGTGVFHSEMNEGDKKVRLLQIWILPDAKNHTPNYGDFKFKWDERKNKFLHMVSGPNGDAPVKIHQDANIYSIFLDEGKNAKFEVATDRQVYLVQIEGTSEINSIELNNGDALESVSESLDITAKTDSHLLLIEMRKSSLN